MFHSPVLRFVISCLIMVGTAFSVRAQNDPSAREDAQIERQKILRAADQIEVITDQHNKIVEELEKLKGQIKALSEENASLAKQVSEMKVQAPKERDALLDQISKLMAEQEKRLSDKVNAAAKSSSEQAAKSAPPKQEASSPAKVEEGYEHVVKPGQTLWSIAQAYRDQGVKVGVEEIRKANNLKEGQALRSGQKLFIPGK